MISAFCLQIFLFSFCVVCSERDCSHGSHLIIYKMYLLICLPLEIVISGAFFLANNVVPNTETEKSNRKLYNIKYSVNLTSEIMKLDKQKNKKNNYALSTWLWSFLFLSLSIAAFNETDRYSEHTRKFIIMEVDQRFVMQMIIIFW